MVFCEQADYYLKHETQFRLGTLVTEQSHPVTAHLSAVASKDPLAALRLLHQVDLDLLPAIDRVASQLPALVDAITHALQHGKNIIFTGCGATGRLSIQMETWWRQYCDTHLQ